MSKLAELLTWLLRFLTGRQDLAQRKDLVERREQQQEQDQSDEESRLIEQSMYDLDPAKRKEALDELRRRASA